MRKIYYNEAIIEDPEINAVCDFIKTKGKRLAYGEEVLKTEKKLADFLGAKHCLLVNSGSSANLLAFMSLTSHTLKDFKIKKGDEIITTALGFPTTISPIVHYGAVPVFVDVDIVTLNIDIELMKKALTPKTKAVFIAHTLGCPANINEIVEFCHDNNLYFIEDCCDALGSLYDNIHVGNFGNIGTLSFYPAHHITCGEGGAVFTNNTELYKIMRSMRDWGRDYKCMECKWDCKHRFDTGYDCRYTYNHFGFNLKVTELQAVILDKQIDRLPFITQKRIENWHKLWNMLYPIPKITFQPYGSVMIPSPFSFVIKVSPDVNRNDFMQYLENNGIGTRVIFGGNLSKQKMFLENNDVQYRISGNLDNTDFIMNNAFFIGCHQGMNDDDINYIANKIKEFLNNL